MFYLTNSRDNYLGIDILHLLLFSFYTLKICSFWSSDRCREYPCRLQSISLPGHSLCSCDCCELRASYKTSRRSAQLNGCSEICATLFYRETQITKVWEAILQGNITRSLTSFCRCLLLYAEARTLGYCCSHCSHCDISSASLGFSGSRISVPTLVMSLLFQKQTVNLAQASPCPHLLVLILTTSISHPFSDIFPFP